MGVFFFFNDTATTEIYTLSLHDALPIWTEDGRRGRISERTGKGEGGKEKRMEKERETEEELKGDGEGKERGSRGGR